MKTWTHLMLGEQAWWPLDLLVALLVGPEGPELAEVLLSDKACTEATRKAQDNSPGLVEDTWQALKL
jgi:hypothetical protein